MKYPEREREVARAVLSFVVGGATLAHPAPIADELGVPPGALVMDLLPPHRWEGPPSLPVIVFDEIEGWNRESADRMMANLCAETDRKMLEAAEFDRIIRLDDGCVLCGRPVADLTTPAGARGECAKCGAH